jgi:tetratricopeptide (TPR) repeat protein
MTKRIFIFLLFTLSFFAATAQKTDFKYIDKKTYDLYFQQKWDSLILVGKIGIKNDIDYYYLRYRMGMAYYYKGKYIKAIQHFEKARKFNTMDTTLYEMLYYSYVFSNRYPDAKVISKKFTENQFQRIILQNEGAKDNNLKKESYSKNNNLEVDSVTSSVRKMKVIEAIYTEGGYTISNNFKLNSDKAAPKKPGRPDTSFRNETDLFGNEIYFHLGLQHRIGKSITLYHGYNYINFTKLKTSKTNIIKTDEYHLIQNEYYLKAIINIKNVINIIPAFHYINVGFTTFYPSLKTSVAPPVWIYPENTVKLNNFIGSLTISKDFSIFSPSISLSFSNLNNIYQSQAGLSFGIYPLGNLDFYSFTSATGFFQGPGVGSMFRSKLSEKRIIISETIGGKLYKNLWGTASFYYGNMQNFNDKNAFVVYNTTDIINYKLDISLLFVISKRFDVSLTYGFSDMETPLKKYSSPLQSTPSLTYLKYQNNSIIGGFKWKI